MFENVKQRSEGKTAFTTVLGQLTAPPIKRSTKLNSEIRKETKIQSFEKFAIFADHKLNEKKYDKTTVACRSTEKFASFSHLNPIERLCKK